MMHQHEVTSVTSLNASWVPEGGLLELRETKIPGAFFVNQKVDSLYEILLEVEQVSYLHRYGLKEATLDKVLSVQLSDGSNLEDAISRVKESWEHFTSCSHLFITCQGTIQECLRCNYRVVQRAVTPGHIIGDYCSQCQAWDYEGVLMDDYYCYSCYCESFDW